MIGASETKMYRVMQDADKCDAKYIVTVRKGMNDIGALETDWRRLETLCPGATFFQSYDFCALWILKLEDTNGLTPYIITVYDQPGRLIGLIPMQLRCVNGLDYLEIMGSPVSQYSDALIDPMTDRDAINCAIIEAFAASRADIIRFENIRDDSTLKLLLPKGFTPYGTPTFTHETSLDLHTGFEAYFDSRGKASRKNLRRKRRKIVQSGTVETRYLTQGDAAAELVSEALKLKSEWMADTGRVSRMFADDTSLDFLSALAQSTSSEFDMLVSHTMLDGKTTLAIQFDFIKNERFYGFLAATAPLMRDDGVGTIALLDVIEHLYERGDVKTLDMLPPYDDYKTLWAKELIAVSSYSLALSWKGIVINRLYAGWLRPKFKALYYTLPMRLRRKIP